MKVIIAGGRDFTDFAKLKWEVNLILNSSCIDKEPIEIVSGTANGADKLGEKFAKEYGYTVKKFPANWDLYGRSAGYKRNKQMAEYADVLIAFWDLKSKGTKNMIEEAEKQKLKIHMIKY